MIICNKYIFLLLMVSLFLYPFQHISGPIRTVPASNRWYNKSFIMLSHSNITPQAQSYDKLITRPVTLFWQRVNQFLRWTTLYMSSVGQGSFNYQFEIFGLTRPVIEPGHLQDFYFVLGLTFNKFQVISGRYRLVTEDMTTT